MLVKDITRLNSSFEFSNDVQLDSFNGQGNQTLVDNYIFTAGNVSGKSSSVALLEKFQNALIEKNENRFLVLATYGQGKSHFGLTLANYFGKPEGSSELETIFDKISAAVKDDARLGAFRDFKRYHEPYLVLLLRGDEPGGLREKFFKALDSALKRDPRTQDLRPPFWFTKAQDFVDNIQDEARANDFLADHRLDLAALKQGLASKRSDLYEVCRNLFKAMYGTLPDFGGETSLSDALAWVVSELCEAQNLFAGAVILFDEFGAFISEYGAKRSTGVPLQEMLNGVENQRGRVLAVAFTHFDPENIVRQEANSNSEELLKQLNRFPQPNRYTLHSPIEEVLRTYFDVDVGNWRSFMSTGSASLDVADASEVAYVVFGERYQKGLGWNSEIFQEKITRDCFPVHPLTISLIANVNFRGASTTRSILGFLTDENRGYLKSKLEQDALVEGRPNWVLPINLVDYFGEMLGDQVWQQYQSVQVPDLKPIERAVLKGMVLQAAAELPSHQGVGGYANLIATLCGHNEDDVEDALKNLEGQRYIRYDAANRTYSFWAGGNGAVALDRLLKEEISHLKQEGRYTDYLDRFRNGFNRVNELLAGKREDLSYRHQVSVSWGHPEDWAAKEFVVTRAGFNLATLKSLASHYTVSDLRDLKSTPTYRGIALLLTASTEEDLQWFRDNVQEVLDRDQHFHAAPMILLLPDTPSPTLANHLVKYSLLKSDAVAQRAKYQVGEQVFNEELERLQRQLKQELTNFREKADIIVPRDARGRINALSLRKRGQRRIEQALKEVFEITYPQGPREFYTQYKHASGHNMRSAIGNLVPVLLENNLANAAGLSKPAEDIVNQYLGTAWGMLTPQWQLKEPTSQHMQYGWRLLDSAFEEGKSAPLAPTLIKLLQLPYGYDPNTLTLLFSAWYGFNRLQLEISKDGQLLAPDTSEFNGRDKPDQFLNNLEHVRIRRRDRSKPAADVQNVLSSVEKGGLAEEHGKAYLGELNSYLKHHKGEDANLDSLVESAKSKLAQGIYNLNVYKAQVPKLQGDLNRVRHLDALVPLFDKLGKLPTLEVVISELPDKYAIRNALEAKAEEIVKQQSEKLSHLQRLYDYGKYQDDLRSMRKQLHDIDLRGLEVYISNALEHLEREKNRLEAQGQEQPTIDTINAYSKTASLSYLQQYRKDLEGYIDSPSEHIQQTARKKHDVIKAEIDALEAFTGELYKRISNLVTLQDTRKLISDITAKLNRFDGRDAEYMRDDLQKCQKLEDFFQDLANVSMPKTPEQAEETRKVLEDVRSRYQGALEAKQISLIDQKHTSIQQQVTQEVERATRWLDQQEQKFDAELDYQALSSMKKVLEEPPPFLDQDGEGKLKQLQQALKGKLDAYTVEAIEDRFKSIKDVDVKRQCVQRLQAILDEQQDSHDESTPRDSAHLS